MLHTIAFYNVENLYDTIDDKRILDGDFSFSGKKSWDKVRYQNKLKRIANAISKIGEEETKRSPTFFGLCEIENKKVIEDLLKHFPAESNYGYVHQDSQDERGIDTAFFYNKELFKIEKADFLRIPVYNLDGSQDFTRDITYVKGVINNKIIHFYVLHLPSKREKDINKEKRVHILKELRLSMNSIFEQERNANVVVMGDFNEDPIVPYVYDGLYSVKKIQNMLYNELYNPFENLYRQGKYSLVYNGKKLLFDQIILSKSFFNEESTIKFIKSDVFNAPFLQDAERGKLAIPFRTYSGNRYLGGYSDHYPVYSVIVI